MKKIIGILMIAMALIAFVSCNNEVGTSNAVVDNSPVDLKLAISTDGQDKALAYSEHYTTGFAVSSYEYTATCTSTPGARGTQATWASLTVSEGSATLAKMDRGTWTISVRAKNSTGGVISQASVNVTLTSNGQVQAINLKNTDGATSATVSIGVTVPNLATPSVVVKYIALANMANLATQGTSVTMTAHAGYETTLDGAGVVATTAAAGQNGFTGSATIAPGLYIMQIQFKDGDTAVAGQMMAFRVVDNTPFAINGALTAGEFLNLQLTPITVDDRIINVTVSSAAAITSDTLACTVSASSTTGALASQAYYWYLDGTLVDGQSAATFSKTGYGSLTGAHVLTCIVTGTINGIAAVGYAQSPFEVNP